jgi:hypothetical protein
MKKLKERGIDNIDFLFDALSKEDPNESAVHKVIFIHLNKD